MWIRVGFRQAGMRFMLSAVRVAPWRAAVEQREVRGLRLAQAWRSHTEFGLNPKSNAAPIESSSRAVTHILGNVSGEGKTNCREGSTLWQESRPSSGPGERLVASAWCRGGRISDLEMDSFRG